MFNFHIRFRFCNIYIIKNNINLRIFFWVYVRETFNIIMNKKIQTLKYKILGL